MNVHAEVFWTLTRTDEMAEAVRKHGVRAVAGSLSVSPQTVSNWLAGSNIPDWAMARMCQLVGFDVPMVNVRDLRRNGGAVAREIGFTGGIRRKSRGRPRKSPQTADTVG
jgi:hypothetical protein